MKKTINCLAIPMFSEFGSRYGTKFYFFPEATPEEVNEVLSTNPEADWGDIRENFRFFDAKERREIEAGIDLVWDPPYPIRDETYCQDGSLHEAIKAYWD